MSTGSGGAAVAVEDRAPASPPRRWTADPNAVDLIGRWVFLALVIGLGFARTWERVTREEAAGAGSVVLLAPVVGALLTAVALRLRRRPLLPIDDRQSDKIVGAVVLVIALMVQWLVLPRYQDSYVLLHLDVLAAWLFLAGACVFLFGLRGPGAYWPAWLVLLFIPPGFVRLATSALGGDTPAQVTVAAVVALAGPVAVAAPGLLGRVRRRRAGEVTRSRDRRERGRRERGPLAAPVVSRSQAWRSAPLLVVVAVALALAPLPQGVPGGVSQGPPATEDPGLLPPEGWLQVDAVDYPWAGRMFGPTATLHRQMIRATSSRQDWDPLLRPRIAAVQSLTVGSTGVIEVFPLEMTFDLTEARVSPPRTVDLGRGVTARYRTVIDQRDLLTWSLMTFVWSRSPDTVQRVSIITVDNHEYDAVFPQAVPGTRSSAQRLVDLLLRGQSAVTDTDSEDKDLQMLTELGTALVEAQWTTR